MMNLIHLQDAIGYLNIFVLTYILATADYRSKTSYKASLKVHNTGCFQNTILTVQFCTSVLIHKYRNGNILIEFKTHCHCNDHRFWELNFMFLFLKLFFL